MKQSPLLEFQSSAFSITNGEDEETNPGVYGKSLALWLAQQLQANKVLAGEVVAEDFGWLVPIQSTPHRLYVVCASEDNETEKWRIFVFAEGGLLSNLFGKDKTVKYVSDLFSIVKKILESASVISNLAETEV